jgi:hypothetical protein
MVSPLIFFRHAARKAAQVASEVQTKSVGSSGRKETIGKRGEKEPAKPASKTTASKVAAFEPRNTVIAKAKSKLLQRSMVADEEARLIQLGGAVE